LSSERADGYCPNFNDFNAIGAYFDLDAAVVSSSTSLNQRFAQSYTGNGWDLTAKRHLWHPARQRQRPATNLAVPAPYGFDGRNPDFINVDLTATKKFGNWEVGAVAFGNTDPQSSGCRPFRLRLWSAHPAGLPHHGRGPE
jgi:hypothetical protein